MALSGDPLKVGPYEEIATHVGDVDSLGLTKLIALDERRPPARRRDARAADRLPVAGAANPLVDPLERLEGKLDAGVGLFQTNIVYDVGRFAAWFGPLVEAGVQDAPRCSSASRRHVASGCCATCTTASPGWKSTTRRSRA